MTTITDVLEGPWKNHLQNVPPFPANHCSVLIPPLSHLSLTCNSVRTQKRLGSSTACPATHPLRGFTDPGVPARTYWYSNYGKLFTYALPTFDRILVIPHFPSLILTSLLHRMHAPVSRYMISSLLALHPLVPRPSSKLIAHKSNGTISAPRRSSSLRLQLTIPMGVIMGRLYLTFSVWPVTSTVGLRWTRMVPFTTCMESEQQGVRCGIWMYAFRPLTLTLLSM